ncbi:MAG: prepilin-type N-terminal cleavage/methylation domain-containing protein, partial [Proteobacteria bacterium]|nr:prepilin-type N-terminal cleavage/methylation domain-containing protein [Pseudomonadota bacterium]
MKTHAKNHLAGFTLIEVIVSLVVAAIMASMIYTYFGNALTQSSVPIFRLQKASNLQKVMENIIADYERLNQLNLRFKWRKNAKYKVGEIVLPSDSLVTKDSKIANNGRYYICMTAGTSSNTLLPSWPAVTATTTTLGRTISLTDGSVVWREEGYVWKAEQNYPANAIVLPAINNGHFYRGPASPNPFTSGATEPTWTSTSTSVYDGSITWYEAGTILAKNDSAPSNIVVLNDNIYKHLTTSNGDKYGTGYALVTSVANQP